MKKIFLFISAMLLIACGESVKQQSNTFQGDSTNAIADTNVIATQIPQSQVEMQEENSADPLIGSYYNAKSTDEYIFKENHTGIFIMNSAGGGSSNFTWKRSGEKLTITLEGFTPTTYEYDSKNQTITEHSESFGTLIYNKE